jgi:lysozyme family protein
MTEGQILEDILRREGGFVNHPADKGGPTNFGITQATLSSFRGQKCTLDDVKKLTKEEARLIYRTEYIDPFAFVSGPKLRALVIDSAVNHGTKRAIMWLQEALGVKVDGIVGTQTEKAMLLAQSTVVYRVFLRRRVVFYGSIIKNNPQQAVFAEGWMRRVAEFI